MFSLFTKKTSLIDESTQQWIFDTFAWAIEHFDRQTFWQNTALILPNNDYYPGRVSSVEQMASSIFQNTSKYAGMANWPLRLMPMTQYQPTEFPLLSIDNALRGEHANISLAVNGPAIAVVYNAQQVNQPQDLIAFYVQQMASILIQQQKVLPPGGQEAIPQAIEVLATVMGFGVMFANTAYQFKGGCGSCYNAMANRQAALPEHEILYCLAVFSHLKQIDNKKSLPHLKSHLRSSYKKMVKEVAQSLAGSKHGQIFALQ